MEEPIQPYVSFSVALRHSRRYFSYIGDGTCVDDQKKKRFDLLSGTLAMDW